MGLLVGKTAKIDSLLEKGEYPNRSEVIRDAARILIRMQKGLFTGMAQPINKDELLKEYAKKHGFKL